jgi:hypothetical protein
MHGKPGSSAGYAIAHSEISNTLSNSNYGSSAAVAWGARLVEATAYRGNSGEKTVAVNFIEHLADQVGTGFRFLKYILGSEFRRRALGPSRDERRRDSHQDTSWKQPRGWNFRDRDLTGAGVL